MKLPKFTLASSGVALMSIMALSTVSCNVNFKSNEKNNNLSDEQLFESTAGKKLINIIENQFQNHFLHSTYLDYFADNAQWQTDHWVSGVTPPIAQSIFASDLSRNMLKQKNGHGNLASDIYGDVEFLIWKNKEIDPEVRSLLNAIRTTYNRTKQIYPIETKIVEHDNMKWGKYVFQVDLISTLERKFMKHYLRLTGEVPLEVPSDQALNNIINYDQPLNNFTSASEVLDILYKDFGRPWGGAAHLYTDANNLNNVYDDWSTLHFQWNANAAVYELAYNQVTITSVDALTGDFVENETEIIAPTTFDKNITMDQVGQYLEEIMFNNHASSYIQALFNGANSFLPKITIVSKAGTSIEGITLDDYVKNFTTVQDPLFRDNYAHFNIYMTNQDQSDWSWLNTDNALGAISTS